jgi:Zn-finger nucleic acid-binding protein
MKCPNDSTTLVMSERSGVEIDYCPECRGVWLDRGELDKILDRAGSEPSRTDRSHSRDDRGDSYRSKKKEHWLGELFG